MNNLASHIARRLYTHGGGDGGGTVSRWAIHIATWGVALGLAIMILATGIVIGFKNCVRDKVAGLGSHIQVLNYGALYNADGAPIQVTDSLLEALRAVPGVKGAQPFCLKTGMLKTDDAFQGVAFRGIDGDYDLDFLRSALVEGTIEGPFSRTESTGRLVISQTMAQKLALKVGSRVYAYFFDGKLRARRFTVEAIYATNVNEYDKSLAFCDFHTAHRLLGLADDQATGVEVLATAGFDSLDVVTHRVVKKVAHRQDPYGQYLTAASIKDMYPNLFSWLNLLDLNVIVILILMFCVAGFTTISGLLILILERTQFIGIMKALGASNGMLRRVFIHYAMMVVTRGIVLGVVLGVGLALLQTHTGLVRLDATTYYVSSVPVQLEWTYVVGFALAVWVASVLVLLLPSYVVSNIKPAQSITFE